MAQGQDFSEVQKTKSRRLPAKQQIAELACQGDVALAIDLYRRKAADNRHPVDR
jgi:hypothetical protein